MSAWFVFSALGFYPVTPGIPAYALGTPLFDEATLHLANGHAKWSRVRHGWTGEEGTVEIESNWTARQRGGLCMRINPDTAPCKPTPQKQDLGHFKCRNEGSNVS